MKWNWHINSDVRMFECSNVHFPRLGCFDFRSSKCPNVQHLNFNVWMFEFPNCKLSENQHCEFGVFWLPTSDVRCSNARTVGLPKFEFSDVNISNFQCSIDECSMFRCFNLRRVDLSNVGFPTSQLQDFNFEFSSARSSDNPKFKLHYFKLTSFSCRFRLLVLLTLNSYLSIYSVKSHV